MYSIILNSKEQILCNTMDIEGKFIIISEIIRSRDCIISGLTPCIDHETLMIPISNIYYISLLDVSKFEIGTNEYDEIIVVKK